jgi:hypothetical protein
VGIISRWGTQGASDQLILHGIAVIDCVVNMRSQKYDPRRYHRSGTLNKRIIGGLLLIAAMVFIAAIIITTVFR